MKTRTLTRKVIIREYDFKKVQGQALGIGLYSDNMSLYDRVSFFPLDQVQLEKLKVVEILKGKTHTPLVAIEWNNNIPAMMMFHLKDYLYDPRYYDWTVSIDEEGYVCVQARKNTPKSRIGWGVFEKDLTCRM